MQHRKQLIGANVRFGSEIYLIERDNSLEFRDLLNFYESPTGRRFYELIVHKAQGLVFRMGVTVRESNRVRTIAKRHGVPVRVVNT